MKKMVGDIILLYIHVYHKWRSYDIWFLKYKVRQTEIFNILGQFLPFQPLDNPENQNFRKLKKNPGDIIILHKCTRNHDHMLYCSLGMTHNGFNCFFILGYFLPFYLTNRLKNQNLEKMKKTPGDIVILQ